METRSRLRVLPMAPSSLVAVSSRAPAVQLEADEAFLSTEASLENRTNLAFRGLDFQTTVPRHSTSSRSTTSSLGCRLVGNIVTYIAGFVVKKALDSVSCSTCQEALMSDIQPDDTTQLYHLLIISARSSKVGTGYMPGI
ncbi:hypothetical protein FJT64_006338 [Amphibalanus amphitrite]|uniref:Uncharacterized protein n=1 Tax=Amphibalanus amphitrite TaxID=1232801 RepID=A0A6A4VXT0_AMPAM|nr:hypothetical protein FJT64_006338 [Amphibalanus amphitrite]